MKTSGKVSMPTSMKTWHIWRPLGNAWLEWLKIKVELNSLADVQTWKHLLVTAYCLPQIVKISKQLSDTGTV